MPSGTQSTPTGSPDAETPERPKLTICESCPGRSVLLESGNTDGWISSDVVVDVEE